jgi:hypothetical protein
VLFRLASLWRRKHRERSASELVLAPENPLSRRARDMSVATAEGHVPRVEMPAAMSAARLSLPSYQKESPDESHDLPTRSTHDGCRSRARPRRHSVRGRRRRQHDPPTTNATTSHQCPGQLHHSTAPRTKPSPTPVALQQWLEQQAQQTESTTAVPNSHPCSANRQSQPRQNCTRCARRSGAV